MTSGIISGLNGNFSHDVHVHAPVIVSTIPVSVIKLRYICGKNHDYHTLCS